MFPPPSTLSRTLQPKGHGVGAGMTDQETGGLRQGAGVGPRGPVVAPKLDSDR